MRWRRGSGFKEAQRRIAEAARTQAGTLDLAGLGLAVLPMEIGKLTALKELYLSGNKLADVTVLGSLTALKRLYLFHNKLTDVAVLGKLTALQQLTLSGNPLTNPPPEVLAQGTAAVLDYLRKQ